MNQPDGFQEFICRKCGDCCRKHGIYPVTSSDIVRLAAGIGSTVEATLAEYCSVATNDGRRGLFIIGLAGECPFLKEDTCIVHDFKPEVCRIFPDNDGFVTVERLKAGLKSATIRGTGLSRCSVWDMPADGVLPPNIEATIGFRIREDTDRHFFASHESIDAEMAGYLAKLAEFRMSDLPLYLYLGRKYGLLRQFYTVGLTDITPLIQAERDIMYRYLSTYAELHMLKEEPVTCSSIRATFIDGEPGIMLTCDRIPESAEEAHYLFKEYGDKGIFSIMAECGASAYIAAFTIDTPCLGEIVRNGELRLKLKSGTGSINVLCTEGVP